MDVTKIRSSFASIRTVVSDLISTEGAVIVDKKADTVARLAAARNLNALGYVDTAVTVAEKRIEKALARLAPKKAKTPKPAATTQTMRRTS